MPGKIELTVDLTRIMFPFLSLVTVAAVLMAMLNALHRFFIPALSPAMFNVSTILCAVIFVPLSARFGCRTDCRHRRRHSSSEDSARLRCSGRRLGAKGFATGRCPRPERSMAEGNWPADGSRIAGLAAVQINLLSTAGLRQGSEPGLSRGSTTRSV